MLHKTKQNKTKLKNKKKNKKSIFQTIEVLNDLSKLKSDFLCFNTFLCKKQNKKNPDFFYDASVPVLLIWCCNILGSSTTYQVFFIISHKPSDLYYYMNGLFLLFIIIITKRNFRPFRSIISFLYHNDHIEMIEILWFKCSLLA